MHIEYLGTRYCYDVPRVYSIVDRSNLNIYEVYTYDPIADILSGNIEACITTSGMLKHASLYTYYCMPAVMLEQIIKYQIDGHLIFVYKCINVSESTSKLDCFYLCDYSFDTGSIRKLAPSFKYEPQLNCSTGEEHARIIKWSFCNKAFSLDFPYDI